MAGRFPAVPRMSSEAMLDKWKKLDLRDFMLPPNWESEKKEFLKKNTEKGRIYSGM